MVTDRLVKYRPRIDRLEMNRFTAFLLHKGAAVDVGVPSLGGKRTLAWLNRYLRLKVRYERRADVHQAFLSLRWYASRQVCKSPRAVPLRFALSSLLPTPVALASLPCVPVSPKILR